MSAGLRHMTISACRAGANFAMAARHELGHLPDGPSMSDQWTPLAALLRELSQQHDELRESGHTSSFA